MQKFFFHAILLHLLILPTLINTELNNFGISINMPMNKNDHTIFTQRISEEMAQGKSLHLSGSHSKILKIQDILTFIACVDRYFNFLLDSSNQDQEAFKLVEISLIDIARARKMLRPQDVTADEEFDLRKAIDTLTAKVNAYKHTDNIDPEMYTN